MGWWSWVFTAASRATTGSWTRSIVKYWWCNFSSWPLPLAHKIRCQAWVFCSFLLWARYIITAIKPTFSPSEKINIYGYNIQEGEICDLQSWAVWSYGHFFTINFLWYTTLRFAYMPVDILMRTVLISPNRSAIISNRTGDLFDLPP